MQIELLVLGGEKTEPKVNYFHVVVLIDHDIVELNIPVGDLFLVQVLDAGDDSAEDLLGLLFGNPLFGLGLEVLVKRRLTNVLHDQHHLLPRVNRRVQLYYILMARLFQDLYLSFKIHFSLFIVDKMLSDHLEHHQLILAPPVARQNHL